MSNDFFKKSPEIPQSHDLTKLTSWEKLAAHHHEMRDFSLREELMHPTRFNDLKLEHEGMVFDFSKHLVTAETLDLLYDLAKERDVELYRDKMFAGEHINTSEDRAVLHMACRACPSEIFNVDGENIMPFVHDTLKKMRQFSNDIISGNLRGYNGQTFTDVINIGIGGSDLGPRFVADALRNYSRQLNVHFVSNVDGEDIAPLLAKIDPARTLFIIASKTFTTEETMMNALVAKNWFVEQTSQAAISKHFVALSMNEHEVVKFGISPDKMFAFKDWVGGRYSLWSSIGLSIALSAGYERFEELLEGARSIDHHFKNTPLTHNIPVRMALLSIWYNNFYDYKAHLLIPYAVRLSKFAKFIQQVDMESNGKSIDRDGHHVTYATSPVVFGETGTDSQHSFMQHVHQSPTPIPADFIISRQPSQNLRDSHLLLVANFLAQTRALAIGQTLEEANNDPAQIFTGNRPSTSIILPELTPYHLGALIAAYEHKVFVQGVIWNLNSFDQPGVALGKKLAKPLRTMLESEEIDASLDSSTQGLMKLFWKKCCD